MALVVKDRVRDSTTTTGTGTFTLSGTPATGYQAFSAIGDGNTTYYLAFLGSEWEVGLGTYTAAGTTLARTTVLASSNSGSAVNFSAGTKIVLCVYPALYSVYSNAAGTLNITVPVASGGTGGTTASDARTNLGLGTAAVANTGTSGAVLPFLNGTNAYSGTFWYLGSQTPAISDTVGWSLRNTGMVNCCADGTQALEVGRKTDDGVLAYFRQAGTAEGSVSVSGTTVSYNAFMGSHWSQLLDGSKPAILKGTVMEFLDEMCEWPGEKPNDRLPKVKVSDTIESPCVYGVFFDWDNDDVDSFDEEGNPIRIPAPTNDMYVAALGAGYIRIGAGYTVTKGMLLDSAGNGCAKPQSDDIVRSRTIAKVTSNNIVETYEDGSFVVACVLMCG